MKKIYLSIFTLLLAVNHSFSQANLLNAKKPSDINVATAINSDKESISYPEVEDSDILWSKVVYEFIDLNEKLNFQLLFPVNDDQYSLTRKSLWKIIRENVENGNIDEVFDVRNDNFLEANKITGINQIKDFYGSKFTP